MAMELGNKVAFVTGAAGGIGLGIARACAHAGMKVAMADIDAAELEKSASALARSSGAVVRAFPMDVTDLAAWSATRDKVVRELGPVQLLCNNAGVSVMGLSIDEITPQLWRKVNAVNVDGVYYGIHTFLDGMRAAGGGHIVNTSSIGGALGGVPRLAAYVASKAAVIGFSEALRVDLAPDGIGVSVLIPGGVRSRLWRTSRAIRGLPDIDVPPDDISGQSARASGDPDVVGKMVIEAVRGNTAYIFTDAQQLEWIEQRHNAILAACRAAGNRAA